MNLRNTISHCLATVLGMLAVGFSYEYGVSAVASGAALGVLVGVFGGYCDGIGIFKQSETTFVVEAPTQDS